MILHVIKRRVSLIKFVVFKLNAMYRDGEYMIDGGEHRGIVDIRANLWDFNDRLDHLYDTILREDYSMVLPWVGYVDIAFQVLRNENPSPWGDNEHLLDDMQFHVKSLKQWCFTLMLKNGATTNVEAMPPMVSELST